MKRAISCSGALVAVLALASVAAGDPAKGKKAFGENGCGACHEIGKDKKGPDLKEVTARKDKAWIVSFIRNPEKHYEEEDIKAYIVKYKVKMPNQEVEGPDAEAIYEYLHSLRGS